MQSSHSPYVDTGGQNGQEPPPAYESVALSQAATPATPRTASSAKNNDGTHGTTPDRPKSDPSERNNTYTRYDNDDGIASFILVPNTRLQNLMSAVPKWLAFFNIKCDDIPGLMRQGFFWSVDNVVAEEGYMFETKNREWLSCGFRPGRAWILAGNSDGENPQWVARLQVVSSSLHVLSSFRLENLSVKNILVATAWRRGAAVYNYNAVHPSDNFNCIYDNKPLQGWWPWPREEDAGRAELTDGDDCHWAVCVIL